MKVFICVTFAALLASANATFGIFGGGSGGQQLPATKIVKIINVDGGNGGGHGGGYSGGHGHGHASPTINLIVPSGGLDGGHGHHHAPPQEHLVRVVHEQSHTTHHAPQIVKVVQEESHGGWDGGYSSGGAGGWDGGYSSSGAGGWNGWD